MSNGKISKQTAFVKQNKKLQIYIKLYKKKKIQNLSAMKFVEMRSHVYTYDDARIFKQPT